MKTGFVLATSMLLLHAASAQKACDQDLTELLRSTFVPSCDPANFTCNQLKTQSEFKCSEVQNNPKGLTGSQVQYVTKLLTWNSSGQVSAGGALYMYGGGVITGWNTAEGVSYPMAVLPKMVGGKLCSSDGTFCFNYNSNVCTFYFSNKSWNYACPVLEVIEEVADDV